MYGRLAVVALGLLGLMWCFSGHALAYEAPTNSARFGPDGTASSNFQRINSVTVDRGTGDVYVLDSLAGGLYKFQANGQPLPWSGTAGYISGNEITGLSPFAGRNEAQVAVDSTSHIIYVTERHSVRAFQESGEPAEFTAGPGAGTAEIPGFGELIGVAVDSNGDIYASDFTGGVSVFASNGELLTSFSISTHPANLVVDQHGVVYVVPYDVEQPIRKATPSEFPVTLTTSYSVSEPFSTSNGQVPVGIEVDPVTDRVFVLYTTFGNSWVVEYDSSGARLNSFGEKAPGEGEFGDFAQGIAVVGNVGGGGRYQFYLGNTDQNAGISQVEIFGEEITEGPPEIEATGVAEVTATSAILRARINPHTFETTYRFEYGTEPCSSGNCTVIPIPDGDVGSGHKGVAVSQAIAGLSPSTVYYYRVVADNVEDETVGPERVFTTQGGSIGVELADGRVWEMVSPVDKHGAGLATGGLIQAAADGNGLAYLSMGSIEEAPEGNRAFEGSTALARRTDQGWQSEDITPPNRRVVPLAIGMGFEYSLFSPDLASALLQPRDGQELSPTASERTPYRRQNSIPPAYEPLVTGKEGFSNVPPGTEFGGSESAPMGPVKIAATDASLTRVLLVSEVPLVAGAPKAPAPSLYYWASGGLHPVSVLPQAEGGEMVAARWGGSGPGSVKNAVSADGSRIFWSPGNYGNAGINLTALYLRDTSAEETVRLDVPREGVSGPGEARPVFQAANSQGSVVFFTDSQQLTADASEAGRDLYRCVIPLDNTSEGCAELTDLTSSTADPGENAEVQGLLGAASDDGSGAYFVAKGILDSAPNRFGESATAGAFNLYAWQAGAGTRFIAGLSEKDNADWGGLYGRAYEMASAGSPNGRFFSFMSERALTGYDNLDASTGEADEEVFVYDSSGDALSCVSCNPSGAAPTGQNAHSRPLVDPQFMWSDRALAAVLPQPITLENAGVSLYRPRVVLDNGRTFIDVADNIVPADSNSNWDVYQYEPLGVGGCTLAAGDAATVQNGEGCVSLLSSGTSEQEAGVLDASGTGDDVFFLTRANLSPGDSDSEADVYDARVGGVQQLEQEPFECVGADCQPLLVPPRVAPQASTGYSGPGNAVHCPRRSRRVHRKGKVLCVKKRHKHSKKHSRTSAGKNKGGAR